MKILLVEDEVKIASALKEGFEDEGFAVVISNSGEDAFFRLEQEYFSIAILDWMLPGRSGVEVLEAIRKKGDWIPVILLTARDTIEDKVMGLEAGADDYLIKPFSFAELNARVHSLIRRNKLSHNSRVYQVADLVLNKEKREVHRGEIKIDLTNREFELLHFLLLHLNQIVTREMLSKKVWKIRDRVTSMDGVIDVHMNRLRNKVDKPFPKALIQTIRGVGFKICEE